MIRGWSLYREKMIAVAGIWGGAIDCTTVVWLHLSKRGISWSCKKYGGAFAMHGVPATLGWWPPIHQRPCLLSASPPSNPLCSEFNPFRGPRVYKCTHRVHLWQILEHSFMPGNLRTKIKTKACLFWCTFGCACICALCSMFNCSLPAVCCLGLCHPLIEGTPETRWSAADFSFVLSRHSSTTRQ